MKCGVILLAALMFALIVHFSFILKGFRGELVIRPDLAPAAKAASALPRKISLAEARKRFDNKSALFVDARVHLFFQAGHIPTAVSLSRKEFEEKPDLAAVAAYKQKQLVLYCSGQDCPDSSLLAAYLMKASFAHIEIFEGGFPEWQDAGYPVEKSQ
jgi:rhodanese-related sulfurtransferase